MSRTTLALLVLALTLLPLPALCQEPPRAVQEEEGSEDLEQVLAGHLRRADEAERRGRHQVVVDELKTAYQMDPQPLFLFRAAQAYQRAGQGRAAAALYREYLQKDPQGPRRAEAQAALAALTRPEQQPLWKRPWFWAIVGGVAVAGVGVGVGLGLGLQGGGAIEGM